MLDSSASRQRIRKMSTKKRELKGKRDMCFPTKGLDFVWVLNFWAGPGEWTQRRPLRGGSAAFQKEFNTWNLGTYDIIHDTFKSVIIQWYRWHWQMMPPCQCSDYHWQPNSVSFVREEGIFSDTLGSCFILDATDNFILDAQDLNFKNYNRPASSAVETEEK